ncbi:MAG TPA: tetratricopeptide repeat protein [Polyangia bacterium]|nr:tetratricopeptide repeat protein [Polyangia bacterium]
MVAIVLVASGATTARADDAQKARDLFTQGNTYFDLGQFDKAIDAWQNGYQLKNDPGFLYNIAQAYRTMGDAQKAIFFYKRYLSNSPKARNRSEVEQKIEALQKQLSQQEQAKGLPPPGPFGPDNPGGNGAPPATEPPSASAAANPEVVVTDGAAGGGSTPTQGKGGKEDRSSPNGIVETGTLGAEQSPPHRIDVRAAIGFDTWSSGLQENAQPSFAFTLAGGYTFGNPASRVRFRLGALFGYTFLKETDSKDTFTSFLIDPTIVVRVASRLVLMGDFGVGVLSIAGLTPSSALLESSAVTVNGSQALSLVRIGVAAEYDLTKNVSLFFWPAYASSAKRDNFYGNIGRFEVLAGVAYRP